MFLGRLLTLTLTLLLCRFSCEDGETKQCLADDDQLSHGEQGGSGSGSVPCGKWLIFVRRILEEWDSGARLAVFISISFGDQIRSPSHRPPPPQPPPQLRDLPACRSLFNSSPRPVLVTLGLTRPHDPVQQKIMTFCPRTTPPTRHVKIKRKPCRRLSALTSPPQKSKQTTLFRMR